MPHVVNVLPQLSKYLLLFLLYLQISIHSWPSVLQKGDWLATWKVCFKLCQQATKSEASYTKNEGNDVILKITK